jgi:hypothetical protein
MSCRACDRGSTNIDVRHNVTINGVYELPFGPGKRLLGGGGLAARMLHGWELAGIATARNGLPVDITMTRKASALPDGNASRQRPNYVPGQPIYATHAPLITGSTRLRSPCRRTVPGETWADTRLAARELMKLMALCRSGSR